MKTKSKTLFRCQECGFSTPKWMGRCPDCGKWNTFVEEKKQEELSPRFTRQLTGFSSAVTPLNEVSADDFVRVETKIHEFDRMLGGGVVPGSVLLLGGPPGIGKSTLMLQVSDALSRTEPVLYVSGEESLAQVKARAERLKIKSDNLYLLSETNLVGWRFFQVLESRRQRNLTKNHSFGPLLTLI